MRTWWLLAGLAATTAACGKKDQPAAGKGSAGSGSSTSSASKAFRDGIDAMCGVGTAPGVAEAAPADRGRVMTFWLGDHVKDPDALAVFEAMATPGERQRVLGEAVERAGLERCDALVPDLTVPGLIDPLEVLAITAVGSELRVEPVTAGPLLQVRSDGLSLAGAQLVAMRGGAIDAASLTADGRRVSALVAWADEQGHASMGIAIAPELPASLLLHISRSVAHDRRHFGLLVRGPAGLSEVPLVLPPEPSVPPTDAGLGMAVTLGADQVVVWSLSGQEGSLAKPRRVVPRDAAGAWLDPVRADLEEIADRRWAGQQRDQVDRRIVIMVDGSVTAGDLIKTLAAVRYGRDGQQLFTDPVLSEGVR